MHITYCMFCHSVALVYILTDASIMISFYLQKHVNVLWQQKSPGIHVHRVFSGVVSAAFFFLHKHC